MSALDDRAGTAGGTQPPVTIRPFALDRDLAAVTELWREAEGLAPTPPGEIEAKLRRDPDLFLVAESAGGLVGVVMGSSDGRRGWISRLAVAAPARRRGVARLLVDEVERRLAAAGVPQVNLMVYRGNPDAFAFWAALGYVPVEDAVLHTRRLDGGTIDTPDGRLGAC